ncbi:hypothetical protein [Streptomyces hesseae]|uniref:Uncharacterized protein n=1 Tax=Streptomyces hesseae TaxID=3075519 RepID=A0ABU2SY37_9ACTN|nr:hypothetical protein [Streptomyces sp. DSM 40473]MDT0453633.1 hypothetical protein [Streptomyces sp. DSM 40473]
MSTILAQPRRTATVSRGTVERGQTEHGQAGRAAQQPERPV